MRFVKKEGKMKGETMTATEEKMTFEEFKNSFFYGDRSNLNFKFLADLSDEQAGLFLKNYCKNWVQPLTMVTLHA